ncbi:MAG TPA: hypothetical protein VIK78_18410 [Ruminiclostridium sp.]
MPEVYYYAKSENVSNIIDCGFKLSTFHNKEVVIDGEKKLCFSGLINPKDDLELYKSSSFRCLKIQVKSGKCFVADRFIYEAILGKSKDMELYYKTIVPIEQYRFGSYRLPECLITTTILAGEASILDKRMDSPVIYSNSEELYINNILQELREQYTDMDNSLLYYFLDKIAYFTKFDRIENINTGTSVFKNQLGRTYCVKKPDINMFCKQV